MKINRRFLIISLVSLLAFLPLHPLIAQQEGTPSSQTTDTGPLPPGEGSAPLPPRDGSGPTPSEGTLLPPAEGTFLPGVEGTTAPPGPGYIGMEQCRSCHEESYQTWIRTRHGRWVLPKGEPATPEVRSPGKPDCESCHGPGSFHREMPDDKQWILGFGKKAPSTDAEKNKACLECHSRGKTVFWKESPHEPGGTCVDCHRVMEPVTPKGLLSKPSEVAVCLSCHKSLRAERRGSPHTLSAVFEESPCSTCHNPHGSPSDHLLTSISVNENCYRCHPEKRGPFLFEHFPVSENCLICHSPHGSVNKNLLKVRQPILCLDCHTNLPGTHDPLNPNSRFTYNRGCINCHPMIHGSNHPSGVRFQR